MYISAFLLGGILCALFQAFMIFTKLDVPRILVLGLALGGLLTPYGMMDALGNWGGAGLVIMTMGAGNAVTATMKILLLGNPLPLLIVLGIFVALTIIGVVAGYLRSVVDKNTKKTVGIGAK